ncbi:MAG: winged helix-turn-helix domain-containing protein [Actinomycetota bacterium]|nr:winged helix-turn-helix domain-containing protein [Actinomycetota bacterium]
MTLSPGTTLVLLALLADPHPTYVSLTERTGLAKSTVYYRLLRLRAAGLVAWEGGKRGTLRALVTPQQVTQ